MSRCLCFAKFLCQKHRLSFRRREISSALLESFRASIRSSIPVPFPSSNFRTYRCAVSKALESLRMAHVMPTYFEVSSCFRFCLGFLFVNSPLTLRRYSRKSNFNANQAARLRPCACLLRSLPIQQYLYSVTPHFFSRLAKHRKHTSRHLGAACSLQCRRIAHNMFPAAGQNQAQSVAVSSSVQVYSIVHQSWFQ